MNDISLEGKKILLLYTHFFNYDKMVEKKLQDLGAEVDLFDARAEINVFEKALKKVNRLFYEKKLTKFHKNIQDKKKNVKYDIIFTDSYLTSEIVNGYKKEFPKATIVLYMNDSVANQKGIEKTFKYYDRVISFDRYDSQKYKIEFRPLFFGDEYDNGKKARNVKNKYDLCFIGTCHSDRLRIIEKLETYCEQREKKFYHFCYLQSSFMYLFYFITKKEYRCKPFRYFSTKQISAEKVSNIMNSSFAILDIQHPKQTGLTMRTIETIGLGKKIITTNKDIANYDFYNKNNFQIIDRENIVINDDFFNTPYENMEEEIYFKYSLTGWVKDIFYDKKHC